MDKKIKYISLGILMFFILLGILIFIIGLFDTNEVHLRITDKDGFETNEIKLNNIIIQRQNLTRELLEEKCGCIKIEGLCRNKRVEIEYIDEENYNLCVDYGTPCKKYKCGEDYFVELWYQFK